MAEEQNFVYVANPEDESKYGYQNMTEYSGPFQPLDKEHGMYIGWIDDIDSGMDGRLYVDADVLRAYVPEGHVAEVPKDIPVDVVPNNDSNNGVTTSLEVTEELSGDGRYVVMGTPESGMNQSVDPVYHNLINKFFEEDVTVRNRKPESRPLINNTAPLNEVEDIDAFLDGGAS